VAPQAPETATGRQGKKTQVHALSATVFRRKNLELAWEKGQKTRGRAGIDEGPSAQCEARQEFSLDLRHRKLREGTSRPQPGKRVESPTSAGGGSKRGIPAGLDRVCQQAVVQRLEPSFEPTFLDSAVGYRRGRSPHAAMRQGWRAFHEGHVWSVDADRRPFVDTIDQEQRSDVIAEESRDGRVRPRVRDLLRAGVREGGCWKPTLTGVPQGGGARPWWSTMFLTPVDRQMTAEGFRLTRWADDFGVLGQTRDEAQRALAVAEPVRREAWGVARPPQKTRVVQGSQGVEFRGSKVKQGAGHRLPAHKRRGRSNPQHLDASPREKSGKRFQEPIRALTRRQVPIRRWELIERSNPGIRGWGHCYRQAAVRRLFHRRDRWLEPRIDAFLAKRWRNPMGRRYPTRRLSAECGRGRLTHLIPGLVP
jgi:RNA-directed DNA polymerase